MTVQTFRDLLKEQPFRPFRLIMSSGKEYEIRHPEMAWPLKTDILIGIEEDEETQTPTRYKTCSLLHVTAIEPLEAAGSS